MAKQSFKSGDEVLVNGEIVEFIGKKGGWTTILNNQGTQCKVRNSEVLPVDPAVERRIRTEEAINKMDEQEVAVPAEQPDGKKVQTKASKPMDATDLELVKEFGTHFCPHCKVSLTNGVLRNGDEDVDGKGLKFKHEFLCMGCNEEFGPEVKPTRKNGIVPFFTPLADEAAELLASGDEFRTTADHLIAHDPKRAERIANAQGMATDDISVDGLANVLYDKYSHLNPGMQRMNLGNILRACLKARDKARESVPTAQVEETE